MTNIIDYTKFHLQCPYSINEIISYEKGQDTQKRKRKKIIKIDSQEIWLLNLAIKLMNIFRNTSKMQILQTRTKNDI